MEGGVDSCQIYCLSADICNLKDLCNYPLSSSRPCSFGQFFFLLGPFLFDTVFWLFFTNPFVFFHLSLIESLVSWWKDNFVHGLYWCFEFYCANYLQGISLFINCLDYISLTNCCGIFGGKETTNCVEVWRCLVLDEVPCFSLGFGFNCNYSHLA